MLYPKHSIEQKLGFDKIRQFLTDACISDLGREYVNHLKFDDDYEHISKLTQQTAEFKKILEQRESFPENNYINALPYLEKAKIDNAFLEEKEFFDLKVSLQTILYCRRFFDERPQEEFPNLHELSRMVEFDKSLLGKIDSIIDERGKVRNTASPELNLLRKNIIDKQTRLRRRLENILSLARKHGYAKEDNNITVRNGRLVIPLVAEHKRKIKGFVHAESATGQTVFLEPTETLDISNEVKELEYKEQREVIRILRVLTDFIRPFLPVLRQAYQFLGLIDFVRAKAKLAVKVQANSPKFIPETRISWQEARHPLLQLNFQEQDKKVVPLQMELNSEQHILLISGPNAGGKSVALKTVGLLQYMFQCGLLIPVAENSTVGLFKNIFIDIGDEQSLDNDLSTYSSHLTNMKHFMRAANAYTLFLIDEFGTGTEPAMGAAISEAILEELHQAKAYGVITTHYTNLKLYAEKHTGVVNGGMRFDAQNMEPLYELEIGRPGSSFAFEIAKKIGLTKKVIEKGKEKLGQKAELDQLLGDLERERREYEKLRKEHQEQTTSLAQETTDYRKLKEYLEREKKKMLNQAKAEAQTIIKQANQKIENTIRQIKESKAEKESTKEARKELESYAKEELVTELIPEPEIVKEKNQEVETEVIEVVNGEIKIGDLVRVKGQAAIGEVSQIKGKDVEILIGALKSNVKLNRLEKVNRKIRREIQKEVKKATQGIDWNEKMAQFSPRLDVRGKRSEDALDEVEYFIDNAILLGQNQLQIVHGKGDGILRKIIRTRLKQYKEVITLKDEHADRGGDGVTLVTLR